MNECKKEKRGGICFYNCDNIEFMKTKPDNCYDLAIVDPPYGNVAVFDNCQPKERKNERPKKYKTKDWDNTKPNAEYWKELFRVSKNAIVWGGNYFIDNLWPSSCILIWDKDNGDNNFADCELAWTTFNTAVRKYKHKWQGMLQQNMKEKELRIHPTQKPVALYKWLLLNYAKKGDRILDTHGGSFSSAIACWQLNFEYVGIEIDEEYFDNGVKRLKEFNQPVLPGVFTV